MDCRGASLLAMTAQSECDACAIREFGLVRLPAIDAAPGIQKRLVDLSRACCRIAEDTHDGPLANRRPAWIAITGEGDQRAGHSGAEFVSAGVSSRQWKSRGVRDVPNEGLIESIRRPQMRVRNGRRPIKSIEVGGASGASCASAVRIAGAT